MTKQLAMNSTIIINRKLFVIFILIFKIKSIFEINTFILILWKIKTKKKTWIYHYNKCKNSTEILSGIKELGLKIKELKWLIEKK